MIEPSSAAAQGVTLANWRQPPWNCWAFHHVSELIPVAPIARDAANIAALARAAKPLPDIEFLGPGGEHWTIARLLPETATDGFLVLHGGRIAFEWYGNGLAPNDRHIVFSVSKSITGVLAGVLVERGQLDPQAPVTRYIPEAAGSVYGDCTVRHVLDMTVGISFVENYLDTTGDFARYRAATGWNPVGDPALASDLRSFLLTLRRDENPHGAKFHYVSPNSDLLGWILERAGGGTPYAQLLAELIWQPVGAEADAHVTVDRQGAARSAGGICVTLRDLARFGEMVRNIGRVGARQIVPQSWIEDIRNNGEQAPWLASEAAKFLPKGCYRSQWYITGHESGAFCAIGIHGQWIYVDPAAEAVIVKLSSQPLPVQEATDRLLLAAFEAIGARLRV